MAAERKISNVTQQEKDAADLNMTSIFEKFATKDKMDEAGFKAFAAAGGISGSGDGAISVADVGMAFQAVKVGKKAVLNYDRFKEAARKLAMKKELTYHELVFQVARVILSGDDESKDDAGAAGLAPAGGDGGKMKPLTDAQISAYASAFKAVDKDNSGSIDASELSTVMTSLGDDTSPAALEELMKSIDIDGNGEISFDEFVVMMAQKNGMDVSMIDDAKKQAIKRLSVATKATMGSMIHEGEMEKRSTTGRIKNWKKRWFVLRSDRLQYFASKEDADAGKLKGEVVFVDGMEVLERGVEVEPKRAGCFLVTGSVDLFCVVEDASARQEWMAKIVAAHKEWEDAIQETLALLVGPDPAMAAASMMNQGADYMNYRQNGQGVALSPFYVQMGKPVPVVFKWDWPETDVDTVEYYQRKTKDILNGTPRNIKTVTLSDGVGKATFKPGVGFSFFYKKGDDPWLSPMQEVPSLIQKLKMVPLLGTVLEALPEHMQKRIDTLPEGKARDMLTKIGELMPLNTFDVSVSVQVDYGFYSKEEQVLTAGQKALQVKDNKLNNPQTRFALRVGALTAAVGLVSKSLELAGLTFLAAWVKESVQRLFVPDEASTEAGVMKLALKKDDNGDIKYKDIEETWEGEREFYENELNEAHVEFLGGLRVELPTVEQVFKAARSRMPMVEDGATVPVLFQWCGEATSVIVKICEVGEIFAARKKAEKEAKDTAAAEHKAKMTEILKKKLGFIKPEMDADGNPEELKLTSFKYEKPARQTVVKTWKTLELKPTPGVGDGPVDPHKKKLKPAKWFVDMPLPKGDYCYKFYVNGDQPFFKEGQPIPEDSDSEYRMMHVNIETSFGLGFDVGI